VNSTVLRLLAVCAILASAPTRAQEKPQDILQAWIAAGTAVGFAELRYDNRDGGHSQIALAQFPGLTALGVAEGKAEVATGPPPRVYPVPVVGNCSMAGGVLQGGSIGRRLLSSSTGNASMFIRSTEITIPVSTAIPGTEICFL